MEDNKSGLEKFLHFLVQHPALIVVIVIWLTSWGSLLVHLVGMTVLLGLLWFYLSNVRFQEGRAYERAIQEAKNPDTKAIRQDAHADLLISMKKAVGLAKS